MTERAKAKGFGLRPILRGTPRAAAQRRKNARDRSLSNGFDAPEGERRGDEGHDLAVRRHRNNGARRRAGPNRACATATRRLRALETLAEKCEVRGAAARLTSPTLASSQVSPRRPGKESPPPPEEKPDSLVARSSWASTAARSRGRRPRPARRARATRGHRGRARGRANASGATRTRPRDVWLGEGGGGRRGGARPRRRLDGLRRRAHADAGANLFDKKLPTQVLDRAGVILRIFASRARSRSDDAGRAREAPIRTPAARRLGHPRDVAS